jgi:hypothetical protein
LFFRDNARVADGDDGASVERTLPARRASATSGSEMAWWQWVDKRIDYRLEAFARTTETAVGQVVAEIRAQMREHCEREVGKVKRDSSSSGASLPCGCESKCWNAAAPFVTRQRRRANRTSMNATY